MGINIVKGTHDIIGEEANAFNVVEGLMKNLCELFGFHEVRPPVIEHSELFIRGVGEGSDVVRKEMYTFDDKGGRSITLRPEFTAGIARLLVCNKMLLTQELPVKCYYVGPVFRYERPQLGRYRQFYQFGVESVGHDSPLNDIEVIVLAYSILQSLGLENVVIKINTLGDDESREAYKVALKEFFAKHIINMCEDCKSRYELNPLRILDCKVPEDQEIVKDAPKMSAYLTEASKQRFEFIKDTLIELQIPFEVDDTLVRGLDYYSDTVFEFHYTSAKGNNYGAIGAGGHYGHLIGELGGPKLPGIGFSFGVERLVSVLTDDDILGDHIKDSLAFYVMPMGESTKVTSMMVANELRMAGYPTEMCFDNAKLGSMFKRAEKKNAEFAVIIGENELANDEVIIKDLSTTEQYNIGLEKLLEEVSKLIEQKHDCECDDECCCHEHREDGCCCHEHHHGDGCCCHHDHKCGCGCNCECGYGCGEMPCLNIEACPCGKTDCECAKTKVCKCLEEKNK